MPSFSAQNYVGLNNGILLTSKDYKDMPLHYDEAHIRHLKNMMGDSDTPTHLGVVDNLFHQIGLNYRDTRSLWSIKSDGSRNLQFVDNADGKYTFDVTLGDHMSNKAKILWFEAANPDKPGIDETPIWIRLDKRLVGANAIIYFSKFAGVELITVDQPKGSNAEGFLYETRLVVNNNFSTYLPSEYLKEGMYVCAGPAITSERNEDYDDRQIGSAIRRFYQSMGNAVNQKYFTVTRNAALSTMSSNNPVAHSLEQHTKMFKLDLLAENSYAATGKEVIGAANVNGFLSQGYKSSKDMQKSIVQTVLVPQLEMFYMALIEAEINWYAVWGNGGTVRVGKDQQVVHLPIGLMRQMMKNANKYSFNITDFRFDHLIKWLRAGVSKLASPTNRQRIPVKTGMGGLELAMRGIKDKFGEIPGILNLNEFLTNRSKDNLSLGFSMGFKQFMFPLGDVELVFEYAEELDSVVGDPNQIDNPIVNGGYRLSSYAFIVDDITGEGNNILELRNGTLEKDFHVFWINGKMPYLGDYRRHAASSLSIPGYEVYIEKAYKAYHVLNPGKTWMYLPINPKTRAMFGANAYDRW